MKRTIGEIAEIVMGQSPKSEFYNNNGDGMPFLQGNRTFGDLYPTFDTYTTNPTKTAKAGDIIMSVRAPVGDLNITPVDMCLGRGVCALRMKNGNQSYLFYLLKHNVKTLVNRESGTVFGSVNYKDIASLVVDYEENEEEQRRIGQFLWDIDQKIETNKAINNNLEQQASVLVRQYCESLTSSVELGTVLSFENGFAFQSSSYHEKGKYRIITIKNVQDGRIDAQGAACIDDIPPRMKQGCFLTIGDVLLSLTGNVGRVGIVCENDLLLNQRVAKLIPKDIRTLPLLYFYFRLPTTKISLETISKGTAQQNLSPIETLKLEIPYETKQALELSNLLQPIFDTIYQKNIENIQLAEIRDSLLPKLMSGELDVSDIEI